MIKYDLGFEDKNGDYYRVDEVDKVIAELIKRLEEGDTTIESLDYALERIANLQKDIGLTESLKCCGNCKDGHYCLFIPDKIRNPNSYCDKWQSDGMTRQERMIK